MTPVAAPTSRQDSVGKESSLIDGRYRECTGNLRTPLRRRPGGPTGPTRPENGRNAEDASRDAAGTRQDVARTQLGRQKTAACVGSSSVISDSTEPTFRSLGHATLTRDYAILPMLGRSYWPMLAMLSLPYTGHAHAILCWCFILAYSDSNKVQPSPKLFMGGVSLVLLSRFGYHFLGLHCDVFGGLTLARNLSPSKVGAEAKAKRKKTNARSET